MYKRQQLGAFYQAKRDRFREQLLATKLKPLPVPGGYFQLVDYSAISDLVDTEFVKWLTAVSYTHLDVYKRQGRW